LRMDQRGAQAALAQQLPQQAEPIGPQVQQRCTAAHLSATFLPASKR
jgi:hypothetical protein